MPKSKLIVSDTSPLLNLSLIGSLGFLHNQFESIVVPVQVWNELMEGSKGVESLKQLREDDFMEVVGVDESGIFNALIEDLDLGESAAIAYAVRNDADLVLIDEKEGRKAARNQELNVTGVIGVILRESEERNIDLQKHLDLLEENGFWISDELYSKIISK